MNKFFHLGVYLTITLFLSIFLLYISYFFPVILHVSYSIFPLSSFFSILLVFYLLFKKQTQINNYWKFVKNEWIFSSFCIGALIIPIIISMLIYDSSWDGQAYHQETVVLLKEGWNPLCHFHAPRQFTVSEIINHYPHCIESLESILYAFTNNLESSKAINIILLEIAFCFSLSALELFKSKLSVSKRFLFAVFLCLSPVVVPQITSFYIDGAWYLLLLSMVSLLVTLEKKQDNTLKYFLIGMLIALIVPTKINAFFFCGFAVMFYLLWLVYNKEYILLKPVLLSSCVGLIIGIFLFGFHPYISNMIDHQHPFYPLVNPNGKSLDIMIGATPKQFLGENRIVNILFSYFNIDKNIETNTYFFKQNMNEVDWRIGGFGILFGLILVISSCLFIYTIIKQKYFNKGIIFFIFSLLIGILVFKEGWWARYVPFFWVFPLLMLLYWEGGIRKKGWMKYISHGIYIIVFVNICTTFNPIYGVVIYTQNTTTQLNKIKDSKKSIFVDFGDNIGIEDKLRNAKISYVCKKISGENTANLDSIGNRPYPYSTRWKYIK